MPTDGLSYDPGEDKYWDRKGLEAEMTRAFEVCSGCRMCFKYCDSFPKLFRFIDDEHAGDVHAVTKEQTQVVVDGCFQCRLCEIQCPYTPRDNHEFQLEFPKFLHRCKALKVREKGVGLRDKVLGDPDSTAALARASLGMANVMN